MAEQNFATQQQLVTVSTDQDDQQRKGDDYERRAANEVNGWGIFSGDFEKAVQFLEKSCSFYKPSKAFDKLAGAQMKIVRCYLKMGNVQGGALTYVSAAKHFKRIQHPGAVTCLSRAAMLFDEIGELSAAGRCYQELGEMSEAEGKISESIGHYCKAAEVYSDNESLALSTLCRTKVAKQAAEIERYEEAIDIFGALAKDAVSSNASKKTAREMFLYAGLCHLCSPNSKVAAMKQALKGFQEVEPNFNASRESKILLYLVTAIEKRNETLYTEVLNTHDVLFRNDALARLLASRGQKQLNISVGREEKDEIPTQSLDSLRQFEMDADLRHTDVKRCEGL